MLSRDSDTGNEAEGSYPRTKKSPLPKNEAIRKYTDLKGFLKFDVLLNSYTNITQKENQLIRKSKLTKSSI